MHGKFHSLLYQAIVIGLQHTKDSGYINAIALPRTARMYFSPVIALLCRHPLPRSEELQKIVSQTDQRPLTAHFLQTSQKKSIKSSRRFDLPEHRFGDYLSSCVDLSPSLCPQLSDHSFPHAPPFSLSFPAGLFLREEAKPTQ